MTQTRVELFLYPLFNVASSITDVLAGAEALRTFASPPPVVQRRYRDVEIAGEVLGAEQFIESFHRRIVARVDVGEITDSYQALLAKGLRRIRHRRCRLSVIDPIAICNPSVTHSTSILGLMWGIEGL